VSPKINISFDHPISKRIDGIEKSYGVHLQYIPQDKEIQYVVNVAYISSIGDDYHCRIERKQLFINGVQPNRLIDVLAERSMKCIYPIDIQLNPLNGIQEVLYFDELVDRWNRSLIELRKEYEGDYANQYFDQMNANLSDKKTFLSTLKNEIIYSLLFFKKDALFEKNHLKKDFIYNLPIDPYKVSEFKGNQRVHFKDQQMIFEYVGTNRKKDNLKLRHIVNRENFTEQKIEGNYISKEREISFKITELQERKKKYAKKLDIPEAIPKELIKRKKSWFSDLFNQNKK